MICMEVNEMRISEFMKKVIVPVGTAVFLGALFYPLCVEQGQCNRRVRPGLASSDGGLLSGENGGYRDFKIGKCQNTVKCLQKKK